MNVPIVAISTCGSFEEAQNVARGLTEACLAACVNIVPGVTSIYRWQGRVEEAQEWMLVIKTRSTLAHAVQEKLRELHSYDVPELITFQVTGGLPAYLKWLCDETSGTPPTLP